jgi:hypothetical protein
MKTTPVVPGAVDLISGRTTVLRRPNFWRSSMNSNWSIGLTRSIVDSPFRHEQQITDPQFL